MRYEIQEKFRPMANSNELLKNKKVAVVGIGGLGSHSAEYLVRMGVGTVILVDGDIVEESNLPRQGLYSQKDSDGSEYKVTAAKKRLTDIDPSVHLITHREMLSENNIEHILQDVDLVLDGTDNMMARYLVNDYCFAHNIPWIYAAATSSVSVVSNFIPGKTPCLRCIYGDLNEDQTSCDRDGIILPALTFITSLQVTEAMKILLGYDPILGEYRYNVWTRQESIFDTSMIHSEHCRCKTGVKKEESKVKFYMICSGDTIQVHTELTREKMVSLFRDYGFTKSKENNLFIEMENSNESHKRIIGYKTGKMVFHKMNKTEINHMFNEER